MLEVEKPTAGRMVDRLERKGWVLRSADRGDRRVNRLQLSAEALRIHRDLQVVAEAVVDDALSLLASEERDLLTLLMERVKRRLLAMVEREGAADAPGGAVSAR
jgi:DNA-binding MarR family transcriptional regulator